MRRQALLFVMEMQNNGEHMRLRIGRSLYKVLRTARIGSCSTGSIDYDSKVITLARSVGVSNRKLSKQEQEQSFYHEVVHGILYDMRHKLEANEKFVESFAKRLRLLKWVPHNKNAAGFHENVLVPQRPERLRKLRKKVSRNKGSS